MWIRLNANPANRNVGDCVVRAIAVATGRPWTEVYDELICTARSVYDMPSSNEAWGLYLYRMGFEPFILPDACPECVTVREFARRFPHGRYIIGTGNHAVAVVGGNYIDTWDSGDCVPSYFFKVI